MLKNSDDLHEEFLTEEEIDEMYDNSVVEEEKKKKQKTPKNEYVDIITPIELYRLNEIKIKLEKLQEQLNYYQYDKIATQDRLNDPKLMFYDRKDLQQDLMFDDTNIIKLEQEKQLLTEELNKLQIIAEQQTVRKK